MEAKEKAKELVDRYCNAKLNNGIVGIYQPLAKQCALICVDEKIESLLPYAGFFDVKKDIEELEKVKQEIEKL